MLSIFKNVRNTYRLSLRKAHPGPSSHRRASCAATGFYKYPRHGCRGRRESAGGCIGAPSSYQFSYIKPSPPQALG